jgi:HEAT repeat protein
MATGIALGCGPKPGPDDPGDVGTTTTTGGMDLGQHGTRAINLLFDAAFSGDEQVREAALHQLMRLAPHVPGTLENLDQGLTEGTSERREACAVAFEYYYGELGHDLSDYDALDSLMDAIRDEDRGVRAAAVKAIGALGPEASKAVPILQFALEKDTDAVRVAAIEALGAIGPASAAAAPALMAHIKSGDGVYAGPAAKALGQIAAPGMFDEIVALLDHGNDSIREKGIWALQGYGEAAAPAVPRLVAIAQDPSQPVGVRSQAIAALGHLGSPVADGAIPALLDLMNDGQKEIGETAADSVTGMGPSVIPKLIEKASSPDPTLARRALDALGAMSPPADQVLGTYTEALDHSDPVVVFAAVKALGTLGVLAAPTIPKLAALMEELEPLQDYNFLWENGLDEGRLDAVPDTLVRIGAGSSGVLIAALKAEMPIVRWRAARALGMLGPAAVTAVPALIDAIEDEDVYVRKDAVRALARIGPEGAPAAFQAFNGDDLFLKDDAVWALGLVVNDLDGAIDLLISTLMSEDLGLRMAAAQALGNAGDKGVAPLIEALKEDDADLRLIIIESLGHIGSPAAAAVPALVNLWGDLPAGDEALATIPTALGLILLDGSA